jgi:hypothetical protein
MTGSANFSHFTVVFFLALFGISSAIAQPIKRVDKEQDGIRARLILDESRAIATWRFFRPNPLSTVRIAINGRPLESKLFPYPAAGQKSQILFLVDLGDPTRASQIKKDKSLMLLLAVTKKSHQQVMFGAYGQVGSLFSPENGDATELIRMLALAPPLAEPSNLSGVLLSAIRSIQAADADRRAIFVFSDGHNDSAIQLSRVKEMAIRSDIAITFILSPSRRSVDIPTLADLAQATGGQVVTEPGQGEFAKSPFALLETGATIVAPLEDVHSFFWQRTSEVSAVFQYDNKTLELTLPAPVPTAGAKETILYLIHDRTSVASVGLMAFFALSGIAFVVARRRPKDAARDSIAFNAPRGSSKHKASNRSEKSKPKPMQALAILQDISDGKEYPITSPLSNIGRATTNEIVMEDPTLSRFHAVLEQQGFGAFLIENRSGNGTLVNHQKIEKSALVDGDLVTMGSTTLRFSQKL